jgi:hypothetical protein
LDIGEDPSYSLTHFIRRSGLGNRRIINVLKEIFEWSKERPEWQRDALRRLIEKGELTETDVRELAQICKSFHGLAEPAAVIALKEIHLPQKSAGSAPVVLHSIFHHRGANALAENQTLHFGPGLTIVYGDNAAGKTGYIRILKSACRARGQEKILGNVVSGTPPPSFSVEIKYKVGNDEELKEWSGKLRQQLQRGTLRADERGWCPLFQLKLSGGL